MTDAEVDEAIDTLKTITDPRGHGLLEALRVVWKRHQSLTRAVEAVYGQLDTGDHSKVAELRVMPRGKPV